LPPDRVDGPDGKVALVTSGDPRHGRRDNGLVASEYAPVGDVDPRVGEHLLDVLALDGIAAYLRPSTDMNPVTRSSSLPNRPTDRLYVDRAHLATARDYVRQLAEDAAGDATEGAGGGASEQAGGGATEQAGGDAASAATVEASRDDARTGQAPSRSRNGEVADRDVDEAWAQIVAGFDADTPVPRRPWPAAEDLSDEAQRPRRLRARRPGTAPRPTGDDEEPSLLDGLDTFGADLPDEEEEEEEPPAPPPLPRPSLPALLGVVGIIGGIVVFLRPDLLPVGSGTAMVLGFVACVAGAVTLVWRLRPGDEDDDHDDGARV